MIDRLRVALGAAMEARMLLAEARAVGAVGWALGEALKQVDVVVDLLDEIDKERAYGKQRNPGRVADRGAGVRSDG